MFYQTKKIVGLYQANTRWTFSLQFVFSLPWEHLYELRNLTFLFFTIETGVSQP